VLVRLGRFWLGQVMKGWAGFSEINWINGMD
jgi:hypothetical protein